MTKVLIVDDEPSLVTLMSYNLQKNEFDVLTATNGPDAQKMIETTPDLDIVLLDVMLPIKSGIDVTKELRGKGNQIPIILVTALDEEIDKILGLEIGADDYITKPFSPREVIARIRAVLRRFDKSSNVVESTDSSDNITRIGSITIDYDKLVVQKNGVLVKLTPKEYELLVYLVARSNRVLARENILDGVWDFKETGPDTRMVDMHISHLRDKLEIDPKHPVMLQTVRGFGYRFNTNGLGDE
ncbi:response regulator transcription factor [Weissella muntiaci]|uniref:Response regulator transcription factor n=1 Tax=Weissella muntiaci TaxID=2508881 RepID=A0A6C2CCU7_9LACO|nr:response regulator transcription factor [Weissella muntiaci]TYC51035.1 response regulator transcription factor [Weissella muntiaci]